MIIVGNGPSIIDSPLGAKINSFDEIVRFNNYKIDGFEKFAGTKTTHWWNVVNFQSLQHPHLLRDYEEICLHSWQFHKEKDKLWQRLSPVCRAEKVFKSDESWIFELQQYGGTKHYGFSTGLLAIWYYLKSCEQVTIHGFDHFNSNRFHHYSKDNELRGSLHDGNIEKKIIDKLLGENKVILLSDC